MIITNESKGEPRCDVIVGGGYYRGIKVPERRCRKKAVAIAGIYKQCKDHALSGDRPL